MGRARGEALSIRRARLIPSRFAKGIFCGLLSAVPLAAHARGGPGAALGSAILTLVYMALVPGALLGLALGRVTWRSAAQRVAALVLVSCIVVSFSRAFGMSSLLALPVMALASMTLAVSVLFSPVKTATETFREAGQWLAMTYLFWILVSLLNPEFLGAVTVPLIVLEVPEVFGKFLPFAWPPLALGIVIAILATLTLRKLRPSSDARLPAFVFNAVLLAVFVLGAEIYKAYLINRALDERHPTCVSTQSFLSSLRMAGRLWRGSSHASFEEDGKRYHWSYSERRFVDATEYGLHCETRL